MRARVPAPYVTVEPIHRYARRGGYGVYLTAYSDPGPLVVWERYTLVPLVRARRLRGGVFPLATRREAYREARRIARALGHELRGRG